MRSLLFACVMLFSLGACQNVSAQSRPNIVLIFIDDMGWTDAGFMGSDLYQTPRLDALASQGMVFSSAYAAAANCAPSRACLLSGQYTPRHGVFAVWSTNRGPENQMRLRPFPNTEHLAPGVVTLGEVMRDAGYVTGMFGKWHLGNEAGLRAEDQGFMVADQMDPPRGRVFRESGDPKWMDRITTGACEFMEANRDRPFFAYISHHATHNPVQAYPETMQRLRETPQGRQHRNREFAAMNADMDTMVGRVLDKLDELGIADNTLVVFTSDNGGLPISSQAPLRGFKGMYYEGGVRVPMIARWPGVIEPGSRCEVPVINVDFMPTFLAAAGADVPEDKVADGVDLMPLFAGDEAYAERPIFWHFPGYLNRADPGAHDNRFRSPPVTVVRRGDWKLHLFHEEYLLDGGVDAILTNGMVELYNLAQDVSEQNNVANQFPEIRDELLAEVLAWIQATPAPLPTPRR